MLRVLVTTVACFLLSDALSSVDTMHPSLLEGFEHIRHLGSELGCEGGTDDFDDKFNSLELPIPTETTWKTLADLYVDAVGEVNSTISTWSERESGFNVPVYFKHVPGKGRGVFAAESISKGELIWEPRNVARFLDMALFREFVQSVPQDLVCDVIAWCYMDPFELPDGTTPWVLSLGLDNGALINDANADGEANAECLSEAPYCGDTALSNIAKDDEICEDYSSEYGGDDDNIFTILSDMLRPEE